MNKRRPPSSSLPSSASGPSRSRPLRPSRPALPEKSPPERSPLEKASPEKTSPEKASPEKTTSLLYGLHAVRQAWLNPDRRCTRLLLTQSGEAAFAPTLQEAEQAGLTRRPRPQRVERDQLDRMLPGAVHQGIVFDGPPLPETPLEDIVRAASTRPEACVVVLDQVTDPHNVGAVLRSAAAFGALALILPDRNAPSLTGVLAKTASGAVDVVPVVRVGNLSQALDQLRDGGFWTVGLAEEGKDPLAALDLSGKIALVLGAEGEGLRRLTMEHCDLLAHLPTCPPIGSLNVSNAAAIGLYEAARSRSLKDTTS